MLKIKWTLLSDIEYIEEHKTCLRKELARSSILQVSTLSRILSKKGEWRKKACKEETARCKKCVDDLVQTKSKSRRSHKWEIFCKAKSKNLQNIWKLPIVPLVMVGWLGSKSGTPHRFIEYEEWKCWIWTCKVWLKKLPGWIHATTIHEMFSMQIKRYFSTSILQANVL